MSSKMDKSTQGGILNFKLVNTSAHTPIHQAKLCWSILCKRFLKMNTLRHDSMPAYLFKTIFLEIYQK